MRRRSRDIEEDTRIGKREDRPARVPVVWGGRRGDTTLQPPVWPAKEARAEI